MSYSKTRMTLLFLVEEGCLVRRKEVEHLREEMELRSALRLNEAGELLKTRGELAQARTDLRKYSRKIVELTTALNNQRVKNISSDPGKSQLLIILQKHLFQNFNHLPS